MATTDAQLLLDEGLEFNDELRYITKNDLKDVRSGCRRVRRSSATLTRCARVRQVGISSLGHRLRIVRAIREFFGQPEVEFDFPVRCRAFGAYLLLTCG